MLVVVQIIVVDLEIIVVDLELLLTISNSHSNNHYGPLLKISVLIIAK